MRVMHTQRAAPCGTIGTMGIVDRVLGRRDPARRAELERAAGAVDRELAGNLELTAMFDQTHQPALFENGEFVRHRTTLEQEIPQTARELTDLYDRMTATETAMER